MWIRSRGGPGDISLAQRSCEVASQTGRETIVIADITNLAPHVGLALGGKPTGSTPVYKFNYQNRLTSTPLTRTIKNLDYDSPQEASGQSGTIPRAPDLFAWDGAVNRN